MNKFAKAAAACAATLIFAGSACAAGEGSVDISFRVGDSALEINGNVLTVETPYVVGEGTTLVPVRVITEAFGAEVSWDGGTKTVTLNYPDVSVSMQIGNKTATVNTHTELLTVAPELSQNGVTMVPLRFISDTFGAAVKYDNETRKITVSKENAGGGSMVSAVTEREFVGDSYYGWKMPTPKSLTMDDRNFDGTYTQFLAGDASLKVCISALDPKSDLATVYDEMKSLLYGKTLTASEKKQDDNGNIFIRLAAKDSEALYGIYAYTNDKYEYYIFTSYPIDESDSVKTEIENLSSGFRLEFSGDSVYDLSNIEGKLRKYKNDEYKFEMKLPADWQELETSIGNRFAFGPSKENDNGFVSVTIASKSDSLTARSWCEYDFSSNSEYLNRDMNTVTDISENELFGHKVFKYTYVAKHTNNKSGKTTDMFFEDGDYVYNVAVMENNDDGSVYQNLLDSLKVETLNSSETGSIIIDRIVDLNETRNLKTDTWTAIVPAVWVTVDETNAGNDLTLMCDANGDIARITVVSYIENLDKEMKQSMEALKGRGGIIAVTNPTIRTFGAKRYNYVCTKEPNDDGTYSFVHIYARSAADKSKTVLITYMASENTNGARGDLDVKTIAENLDIKRDR